jgi:DNA processing protein
VPASVGIEAIAWNDPRFPAQLLAIADCPPALWCRGSLECLGAPLVAIVGSRAASAVSVEIAARVAADLAERGVTVVSGLARGVDSAAHRGALQKGTTVAVLGSGVDRVYPASMCVWPTRSRTRAPSSASFRQGLRRCHFIFLFEIE